MTPKASPVPVPAGPMPGDAPVKTSQSAWCGYPWYFYRINNGVQERSFYPDSGYVSTDPRQPANFDPIAVKAYELIKNHMSSSNNKVSIEYHVDSHFPVDELSYLKTQINAFVDKWSDHFEPNAKLIATFVTEKDPSVMTNENSSNYSDLMDVVNIYKDKSNSGYLNCGWRNGISGSHTIWQGKNAGVIGFAIVFPSSHDGTYWLPKNLPHEITHGLQDLIWFKSGYPAGSLGIYNLIEGGAELFGTAQGYSNIGWYQDEINRYIVESYVGNPDLLIIPKTNKDILMMLDKTEHNDGGAGTIWAYSVGMHLWEYMIANYGLDSYWKLVDNVQKTDTYDQAVLQTLGITKSELYKNAAPYILKQFNAAFATMRR